MLWECGLGTCCSDVCYMKIIMILCVCVFVRAVWEAHSLTGSQDSDRVGTIQATKRKYNKSKDIKHFYGTDLDECGPAMKKFKQKINMQKLSCSLPNTRRKLHYMESPFLSLNIFCSFTCSQVSISSLVGLKYI